MNTSADDEEEVARAIHAVVSSEDFENRSFILDAYRAFHENDVPVAESWGELEPSERDYYKRQARAAIQRIQEMGRWK